MRFPCSAPRALPTHPLALEMQDKGVSRGTEEGDFGCGRARGQQWGEGWGLRGVGAPLPLHPNLVVGLQHCASEPLSSLPFPSPFPRVWLYYFLFFLKQIAAICLKSCFSSPGPWGSLAGPGRARALPRYFALS